MISIIYFIKNMYITIFWLTGLYRRKMSKNKMHLNILWVLVWHPRKVNPGSKYPQIPICPTYKICNVSKEIKFNLEVNIAWIHLPGWQFYLPWAIGQWDMWSPLNWGNPIRHHSFHCWFYCSINPFTARNNWRGNQVWVELWLLMPSC